MSWNAHRHHASDRKLCPCGEPARYWSHARGRWRWAADHDLCQRCWSGLYDAARARRLRARRRPFRSAVPTAEAA